MLEGLQWSIAEGSDDDLVSESVVFNRLTQGCRQDRRVVFNLDEETHVGKSRKDLVYSRDSDTATALGKARAIEAEAIAGVEALDFGQDEQKLKQVVINIILLLVLVLLHFKVLMVRNLPLICFLNL